MLYCQLFITETSLGVLKCCGETLLIIPALHTERESSDFMTDGGDLSQSNERFYLPKDNTGMGGSSGHKMFFFISIQLNVVLHTPVKVLSGYSGFLPHSKNMLG